MRCSSTAMLTVPTCLFLMFHISVEVASTTREYAWATGSPFEEVDACERYGYEFCDGGMVAPDDLDCHYFYQCNQGHWERQECAPPTYFDVDTYLCQQQMFVTCQEECPPYTGAPFPDPGANPKGPCPGTDGSNCEDLDNYPDKHSCSYYHICISNGLVQQVCPDQTVFDLDEGFCITPGSDFSCFPRCSGITFPDTSSEAMTTYTTPMVTTLMPTSGSVTGESSIDPIHTVTFEDTDATTRDVSIRAEPTDSTATQQTASSTIAPTEPMTDSTTEQQRDDSSDSTIIIIGGAAAGGAVVAVAAVYFLHRKSVITVPFTANSAAKAGSASGNVKPPNSNIFGGKATPPKVTHVPKALKY